MDAEKIFVGRKAELEQFKEVLEDPKGQAVLVVGQAGMGKTWLINKMTQIAEKHPNLKCGWVRYEVTPTDSVDSTMALMMDNAFEAAQVTERSFSGTSRRLEQWRSLMNVINIGDLVMSLRRDPAKNTRDQFLERLALISKKMPKDRRAVFVIDPEKYMQEKSDQSWAIVANDLPEKIKFVFAQRPEDVLVESEPFDRLDNVVCIPAKRLDVLSEEDVDELVNCRKANLRVEIPKLRKVLERYKGHPYAIGAALDLIEAGVKLEELPDRPEPTEFAKVQWKKVCDSRDNAIELFEAYAILEVGVPNDVVQAVSKLKTSKLKKLLADKYLGGLLREEGEGRRIYHAILADYILGQIGEAEKKEYHSRAMEIYRGKLAKAQKKKTKPDALAAMRLAEHVLAAEGPTTFVYTFVNECTKPLLNLGLLDEAISLSKRALGMVKEDSKEQAMILSNLGILYGMKGELNKAEEMHKRALVIDTKLGLLEGIAGNCNELGIIYFTRGQLEKAEMLIVKSIEISGTENILEVQASGYGNLGNIYLKKDNLDKAEEMYKKSLEISEKLGLLDETANQYGNLGVVYQMRGKLDKAKEMLKKSLEINEKIGRLGGMAIDYCNLGEIYKQRGDLAKVREYWEKSRDLYKRIGIPNEVEEVQGWIDAAGSGL